MSIFPEMINFMKHIASGNMEYLIKYKNLFNVFNTQPNISDKDLHAEDYKNWTTKILDKYNSTGKVWYK